MSIYKNLPYIYNDVLIVRMFGLASPKTSGFEAVRNQETDWYFTNNTVVHCFDLNLKPFGNVGNALICILRTSSQGCSILTQNALLNGGARGDISMRPFFLLYRDVQYGTKVINMSTSLTNIIGDIVYTIRIRTCQHESKFVGIYFPSYLSSRATGS